MKNKKLSELRKGIDRIDRSIMGLLNRRGEISRDIGKIKNDNKQPVYSPDRESQVYRAISGNNPGPLKDASLRAIYMEIMSACIAMERGMTIAYLGPELTFTHQAAMKKFGSSVKYLSCNNISDVFHEVEKGNADYGVVPVENSFDGAVSHTMDMFMSSSLMICSEIYLRIRHSLLSKMLKLGSIRNVYSKQQVFGQCRIWLEKNLPNARLRETASTAKAAEISARDKSSACIASELVAKKYNLKVISRSIEDSSENTTRFLVIGKDIGGPSGSDKTSVMFSVKDRAGILHDMLGAFKKEGINLSKIESRPSKRKLWEYYFFVDMEGHWEDKKVKNALRILKGKCDFVKFLGSYPKG